MPAKVGAGRTNPDVPIPGRVWYRGAWRTPKEKERNIEAQRAKRRAASGGVDRRRGPRKTDEEKEATRLARSKRRAARLRERRRIDHEWAERDRARQRGRYVPRERRNAVTPEERERRAKAKRHEAAERRRAARRNRERVVAEKARNRRAPAEVRAAWSRAKPGSIIRRKYPAMKDLDASALRGEWEGWR
jgi:hypothetical protein